MTVSIILLVIMILVSTAVSLKKLGIMTLTVMALGIMTLSVITQGIITLNIITPITMPIGIKTLCLIALA